MAHRNSAFMVVLGMALVTACDRPNDVAPIGSPARTAVICADAPQLRQRAVDNRRQSGETTSDQEKIVASSRATFYLSLALIADLKCRVASAEADATLTLALAAAGKAGRTRSFYESAVHWAEASVAATEAVSILMKQLPSSLK